MFDVRADAARPDERRPGAAPRPGHRRGLSAAGARRRPRSRRGSRRALRPIIASPLLGRARRRVPWPAIERWSSIPGSRRWITPLGGLTYEQIDTVDAAYRARWEADPAALRCPDGESGEDVGRRAGRSWRTCSPGPLRRPRASRSCSAWPTARSIGSCSAWRWACRSETIGAGSRRARGNLTVIRWPSGAHVADGRLLVANDTSHLAAPGQSPWELAPGA